MTAKLKTAVVCLSLCLPAALSAAQESDAPGSKDHPMIKRYQGSWITEYDV